MALNQRLARLERVSHLSGPAEPMVVVSCSCGRDDPELPPNFNGHVIRIIRSGEDCPHQTSNTPRQAQAAQAPAPASA